jgi:hypothetical protein
MSDGAQQLKRLFTRRSCRRRWLVQSSSIRVKASFSSLCLNNSYNVPMFQSIWPVRGVNEWIRWCCQRHNSVKQGIGRSQQLSRICYYFIHYCQSWEEKGIIDSVMPLLHHATKNETRQRELPSEAHWTGFNKMSMWKRECEQVCMQVSYKSTFESKSFIFSFNSFDCYCICVTTVDCLFTSFNALF